MTDRGGNRRWAIRRGLGAAGGLAVAGALAPLANSAALADASTDLELVEAWIELEQRAAVAYETIAEGDLLDEEVRRAAELFATQERDHVDALTAAIEDLGGRAPSFPRPVEVVGLSTLGSQRQALELALALEGELVAAYVEAAGRLESTALLRTAAQILGNDAQHQAVLRQQLGHDPVPEALEDGVPELFETGAPATW